MRRVVDGMRYTLAWINEAFEGNEMAEQSIGKTSVKTPIVKAKVTTTTSPASATPNATPSNVIVTGNAIGTVTPTQPVQPAQPPKTIEWSPRVGVLVSVNSLEAAFRGGDHTRGVALVQRALIDRGFDVPQSGYADYDTRAAYAKYQRTIDERPTGLPTVESLDILGFDVT